MSERYAACFCQKSTLILAVFCSALILSVTATMAVAEVAKVSTKNITRDTPLKFEFALDLGGNPGVVPTKNPVRVDFLDFSDCGRVAFPV
jgi:hypothetical protein